MGKLNILDPTGHVEINWDSQSIHVDLNPEEGTATKKERKQVAKMIEMAMGKNFVVKVDDKEIPGGGDGGLDLKQARRVDFELLADEIVKEIIQGVVKSEVLSSHLLFKIGAFGRGQLIQKSEFEVDDAEYTAQPALAGG